MPLGDRNVKGGVYVPATNSQVVVFKAIFNNVPVIFVIFGKVPIAIKKDGKRLKTRTNVSGDCIRMFSREKASSGISIIKGNNA